MNQAKLEQSIKTYYKETDAALNQRIFGVNLVRRDLEKRAGELFIRGNTDLAAEAEAKVLRTAAQRCQGIINELEYKARESARQWEAEVRRQHRLTTKRRVKAKL